MSRWPNDGIIGFTANRLTVEAFAGFTPARKRLVQCKCECGNTTIVVLAALRGGKAKSCGCLLREKAAERMKSIRHLGQNNRLRHGMSYTPEYYIWRTMKARCTNPKSIHYPRYGGRGITLCDRWMVSDNFFADMGPRPSAFHTIDRIDNEGNYEPSNCRWATPKEQGNNRSTNIRHSIDGVSHTVAEWAEQYGISRYLVYQRLSNGWSIRSALTTPPTPRYERRHGKPLQDQ